MIKRLAALLAALVLCVFLSSCAMRDDLPGVTETLSVWCTADSPVTAALADLTSEYNARSDGSVPVQLKVFPSESAMAEAFNIIRPDLMVCTRSRASRLVSGGQLSAVPGLPGKAGIHLNPGFVPFSDDSFIPLGGEGPLLLCAPGFSPDVSTLSGLIDAAAVQDGPFMAVSFWSDVFAAVSCGSEFGFFFDLEKDAENRDFSELYNLFAELSYSGRLSSSGHAAEKVAAGELSCAVISSSELAEAELEGCSLVSMPDMIDEPSQFLSAVWGFAVSAPAGRSAEPAAAFIRWLFDGSRLGDAAVRCGLIPASACTVRENPLYAALFDICRDSRLYALPEDSAFYDCRYDFDAEVTAAMARLY